MIAYHYTIIQYIMYRIICYTNGNLWGISDYRIHDFIICCQMATKLMPILIEITCLFEAFN